MIITRTPMRISFVGGGTDTPAFYRSREGSVISTAIDKYVYVMLNPKFDGRYRVSYSVTENVADWKDIQHDTVREVMHLFGFKGMEVTSVSDIPGEGSGLGSSSAFTVGLLRAAYAQIDMKHPARSLAEDAFKLEAHICGHPVGKQDHYAAACGGLAHYSFRQHDVKISTFGLLDEEYAMLHERLLLLWTGVSRKAEDILGPQAKNLEANSEAFRAAILMAEVATELKGEFEHKDFRNLGRCVAADWKLKQKFAEGIGTDWINDAVHKALDAGAEGAKICGAGGGGFMLVVADPKYHPDIEATVGFRRVPFKIEPRGSVVLHGEEQ